METGFGCDIRIRAEKKSKIRHSFMSGKFEIGKTLSSGSQTVAGRAIMARDVAGFATNGLHGAANGPQEPCGRDTEERP